MNRRSQIEIIYDILAAVQMKGNRIKPTHLLYKSNLSHTRMKKYINELMAKGLLAQDAEKEKSFFFLTEQGMKFISDYRKVRELTEAFGL